MDLHQFKSKEVPKHQLESYPHLQDEKTNQKFGFKLNRAKTDKQQNKCNIKHTFVLND
jgi:hypothetical protein